MLHGLPATTASLFGAARKTSDSRAVPPRRRFRTLFLSDLHLGCSGARAEPLARLLERIECHKLYLVGDIIDMWQLRRRWLWNDACDQVVGRLVEMAKTPGCAVIFIPGNHDDAARRYAEVELAGIHVKLYDVHPCLDGRKLFVTHGDQYDLVVKHSRFFCLAGDAAYEVLLKLNALYNRLRALFGRPYWSLSQYVKGKVKSACTFISRFEETLLHEAQRVGLDGVVCGHIHKPEEREDEATGMAYYNCGDWVESCTLIAEGFDGKVELIDGLKLLAELEAEENEPALAPALAS